jgi:hypothetical protein
LADQFLSRIPLNDQSTNPGPALSTSGLRASDKGFLSISTEAYLQLLDWTARRVVQGKSGSTPESLAPLFVRLGLDEELWYVLVSGFGRMFYNVEGRPRTIDACVSRITQRRYHVSRQARELFAKSGKA